MANAYPFLHQVISNLGCSCDPWWEENSKQTVKRNALCTQLFQTVRGQTLLSSQVPVPQARLTASRGLITSLCVANDVHKLPEGGFSSSGLAFLSSNLGSLWAALLLQAGPRGC